MKKIVLSLLMCSAVTVLTACQGNQETSKKTENSERKVATTVSETTKTSEEATMAVSSSGKFIDTGKLIDDTTTESYNVPKNISDYAGSYAVKTQSADDYILKDIQVNIEKDGTFRKLVITYSEVATTMFEGNISEVTYGYFNSFNEFKTVTLTQELNGRKFGRLAQIEYSTGVVVEKFDGLYLVDLFKTDSYNPILNQAGDVDYLATVIFNNSLPNTIIDPVYQDLTIYFSPKNSFTMNSTNLGSYDQVTSDGIKTADQMKLQKSAEVFDVLKTDLSEIDLENYKNNYLSNTNSLYQYAHGSEVSYEEGEGVISAVTDFSKFYSSSGDKLSGKFGYVVSSNNFNKATILVDGAIYRDISEQDGKYIRSN